MGLASNLSSCAKFRVGGVHRCSFGRWPVDHFLPELGVDPLDVFASDGVLKLEVAVASELETVGRIMQAKTRARREPFIEFDFPNFAVEQVEGFAAVAHFGGKANGVAMVGAGIRRRVGCLVQPRGSDSNAVAACSGHGLKIREVGTLSWVEEIKALRPALAFGTGEVLASVLGEYSGWRHLDAAVGWAFAGENGGVHDAARSLDVLFEVKLAHAERVAVGVEALAQGITYEVGDGMVCSDVLSKSASATLLANSRLLSRRGGLRKETSILG